MRANTGVTALFFVISFIFLLIKLQISLIKRFNKIQQLNDAPPRVGMLTPHFATHI